MKTDRACIDGIVNYKLKMGDYDYEYLPALWF